MNCFAKTTGREIAHAGEKIYGCWCTVAEQKPDGSVNLVMGQIADPRNCVIDEETDAVLFVEYEEDDDWYLAHVYADTQIILFGKDVK